MKKNHGGSEIVSVPSPPCIFKWNSPEHNREQRQNMVEGGLHAKIQAGMQTMSQV